jgi:hypothetical protein
VAAIPEAVVTPAGVSTAPRAAAAGDTVIPTDDTYVQVANTSGSTVTVTVVGKRACSQGVIHDMVASVPTATTRIIGPIKAAQFADPATGLASVNYSATGATVQVASIRQ